MAVQIIEADLFKVKADAYAHGVNCHGRMGKGIAVQFKKRWPEMFRQYQVECSDRGTRTWRNVLGRDRCSFDGSNYYTPKQSKSPGDLHLWSGDNIVVANLFIQDKAMSNAAQYGYLDRSLRNFAHWLGTKWTIGNIYDKYTWISSIAMPFIGCGIGGLHKDGVESIVRHIFDDWCGIIYICDLGVLRKK